jgi:organic radical activating enzyme
MKSIKIINPPGQTFIDYPDRSSLALLIYFIGCDNTCEGCHNYKLKNINYSLNAISYSNVYLFIRDLILYSLRAKTNKIVLSGGDPLSNYNIEFVKEFLNKSYSLFDVCIYTGHDIKYVKKNKVKNFKFIKTGSYNNKTNSSMVKNNNFMMFASDNQKLYNENFKLLTKDSIYYFKD